MLVQDNLQNIVCAISHPTPHNEVAISFLLARCYMTTLAGFAIPMCLEKKNDKTKQCGTFQRLYGLSSPVKTVP